MKEKFLPIGTVVKLKGQEKKIREQDNVVISKRLLHPFSYFLHF